MHSCQAFANLRQQDCLERTSRYRENDDDSETSLDTVLRDSKVLYSVKIARDTCSFLPHTYLRGLQCGSGPNSKHVKKRRFIRTESG